MKTLNPTKIIWVLIAVICFLGLNSFAQKTEKPEKIENALLWKITGNDLEKPSYLFGTIHIICANDFELKEKVKNHLLESKRFVAEVNLNDPKEMKVVQKAALGKKPLSQELSAADLASVDSVLKKKLGVSSKPFDNYTLQTIFSVLLMKGLPCGETKFYEIELAALAGKNQIPFGALETATEQLDYISKPTTTENSVALIKNFEGYIGMFTTLMQAYKKEELSYVYSTITDAKYMNSEERKWILTVRNHNWAKRMPEMMKKEQCFFAVGTAHLPGKDGMISLLKAKGYTLTPVKD